MSLRRRNEQVEAPPLKLLMCQARIAWNLRMLSFLLPSSSSLDYDQTFIPSLRVWKDHTALGADPAKNSRAQCRNVFKQLPTTRSCQVRSSPRACHCLHLLRPSFTRRSSTCESLPPPMIRPVKVQAALYLQNIQRVQRPSMHSFNGQQDGQQSIHYNFGLRIAFN